MTGPSRRIMKSTNHRILKRWDSTKGDDLRGPEQAMQALPIPTSRQRHQILAKHSIDGLANSRR